MQLPKGLIIVTQVVEDKGRTMIIEFKLEEKIIYNIDFRVICEIIFGGHSIYFTTYCP